MYFAGWRQENCRGNLGVQSTTATCYAGAVLLHNLCAVCCRIMNADAA